MEARPCLLSGCLIEPTFVQVPLMHDIKLKGMLISTHVLLCSWYSQNLFVFCLNSASPLGLGCGVHHEWADKADSITRRHAAKHKKHEKNLQAGPAIAIL